MARSLAANKHPRPSSWLGDEKRSSDQRSAYPRLGDGVAGLRRAACLWQAVPKGFTRTELMVSVLVGTRLKGGGTPG
jgi:hypothetical protein